MRALAASLVGLLVVVAPAVAQAPEQQREREHVVRTGDTLWDLAQHYFANPYRWRMIHEANTHLVADPHWIYPEQVLIIPGVRDVTTVAMPTPPPVPERTVFYREPPPTRGNGPTVLLDPMVEQLPVRPGEFHAAPFLLDPMWLDPVGQVLRPVRQRQEVVGLTRSAHPQDEIYVGYRALARPEVGDRLMVLGVGDRVRPVGRQVRIIEPRAFVRVERVADAVMVVRVEHQFGRIETDDFVIRPEMFPDFTVQAAEPVPEGYDLTGQLIRFATDQALYGRLDRGFIDLGREHGVSEGDVFEAYLPERRVRARRTDEFRRFVEVTPEESIATLRVIRAGESTSTVIVDEAMAHALTHGVAVRRVRAMP